MCFARSGNAGAEGASQLPHILTAFFCWEAWRNSWKRLAPMNVWTMPAFTPSLCIWAGMYLYQDNLDIEKTPLHSPNRPQSSLHSHLPGSDVPLLGGHLPSRRVGLNGIDNVGIGRYCRNNWRWTPSFSVSSSGRFRSSWIFAAMLLVGFFTPLHTLFDLFFFHLCVGTPEGHLGVVVIFGWLWISDGSRAVLLRAVGLQIHLFDVLFLRAGV